MKFRRLVILLIIAAILIAFITKPTKEKFMQTLLPVTQQLQTAPVVDFKDKLIYTDAEVTYVDAANPVNVKGRTVASARKENYIGLFGRFWKLNKAGK